MANSGLLLRILALLGAALMAGIAAPAQAQIPARAQPFPDDAVRALAPTGKLRVGVLMVWYFAQEDKAVAGLIGPRRSPRSTGQRGARS
jgi:hypothetical protein